MTRRIDILGAGLSGLSAATILSREGYDVHVYEIRADSGARFDGDFQGIENWTSDTDFFDEMREWGFDPEEFKATPFNIIDLIHPDDVITQPSTDKPAFRVVERGTDSHCIDQGFKRMAQAAGATIHYETRKALEECDIIAAGPKESSAIAFGEIFHTDHPNHVSFQLNDKLAPGAVVRILQNSFWSDRPHIPKGGCKGVIDGLRADLRENGAKLWLTHEITEILPGDAEEETKEHRFCVGVRRRGRDAASWVGADSIIHNGGHPNLLKALSDDFEVADGIRKQIADTQAVGGIGFCFALDDDIPVRSSGVTMLPNLERVGGFVIPTFSDPSLAPEGKHLMITHQFVPDPSVKSEISKGREDLYEAIPWLADHGEEICVHTYHRNWPCNRAPQGAELPMDIGVEGIRLVGDGVKGHGWMMVEGIAANLHQAVDEISAGMRS